MLQSLRGHTDTRRTLQAGRHTRAAKECDGCACVTDNLGALNTALAAAVGDDESGPVVSINGTPSVAQSRDDRDHHAQCANMLGGPRSDLHDFQNATETAARIDNEASTSGPIGMARRTSASARCRIRQCRK